MGVRPGTFECVCTHVVEVVEVLGQESTVLIHLGGQFAGDLESTIGLDSDSNIHAVFQSRGSVGHGATVSLLPWASVLSNRKTQSTVIVSPAVKETQR